MNTQPLAATSLTRRFAVAAAILTAAAVALISLASFWLVNQQRTHALALLQQKEAAFHSSVVSSNLQAIATRMSDVADSPILATALVDSAGRETYLTPYLNGVRQINGVPIQLLFTDFEGNEISSNGNARFSQQQLAWLKNQLNKSAETAAIFPSTQGPELVAVELLRYSRTQTPEGALLYKLNLNDLQPSASTRLTWGQPAFAAASGAEPTGVMTVDAPPIFRPLVLRTVEHAQASSIAPLDRLAPQFLVIAGMILGLAALVFVLGKKLAFSLTRDLRQLEAFSSSIGDEGLSMQRAQLNGSAEVASLAQSINRMLDRLHQQQTQLQQENEKFHLLANTIPQLAWIADPDGQIHWYNDRWYEYTGATPKQMEGWGWQSVHDPQVLPSVLAQWKRALSTGEPFQMSFPLRRADGIYHSFFTSVAPLRDAAGNILQWFGTNTDVSQLEQAENAVRASEERLQESLVAARMAVWDWQLATGKLSFSANLQTVFGCSWSKMSEAWKLVHPDDLPALRNAIDLAIVQHGQYHSFVRVLHPGDAGHVWIEMLGKVSADEDGKPESVQSIAMDVSERKRTEEALRMADRRKDEFLAMLAHELRNPLAPISAGVQLLEMVYVEEPRVRQISEIISRQVKHMTHLVDDLLDVSRVTRGLVTLNRERIDLKIVVANAIDQVRSLIDAKQHQLSVQLPPEPVHLHGDHTRLTQVVANLLNNAAKYTPQGGRLQLLMALRPEQAEVRVRDNGAGIAPDLLPDIFELFTQGKRTLDRSQGGLGLGLALVKKLVELHAGSVRAYSAGPGQGSEFVVRLPYKTNAKTNAEANAGPHVAPGAEPSAETSAKTQSDAALQPAAAFALPWEEDHADALSEHADQALHVMVVDDNADAANTLALLLQAEGHHVSVQYTAHAALEAARRDPPQVFLLDIGLPDLNGYDLARRLRAMPETAHASLIAVTGYGKEQDRQRSKAAGFARHLVKPVHAEQLSALFTELGMTHTGSEG